MPIYYNGKKIKNVYYGGRKIKEAWYGGRKVYSSQKYPDFVAGQTYSFGDKVVSNGVVYMYSLTQGKGYSTSAGEPYSRGFWALSAAEEDLSPKRTGTTTTWGAGKVYQPGDQVQVDGYWFVCTIQHYSSNSTRPFTTTEYFRAVLA